MRQWLALFESAEGVSIDMLPRSVKQDLLDMFLGPNAPPAFEPFWESTYGIMSFDETYLSQFLFGEEDLDETGGYMGDTFKVAPIKLKPDALDNSRRSVSDLVVGQYAARTTKAPPILIRREGSQWKLVEGGHRLAAAKARGDTAIPAYDVTIFFKMSAADWQNLT